MGIPRDKLMHFGACCIASVAAMVFFRIIASPMGAAACGALLISIALGVGKEYGDMTNPYNHWDWKDFLADVVGAIVGTAMGSLLWSI